MIIRMTIRRFDPSSPHHSMTVEAGHLSATAANKTWQGPGIPQAGGIVDVEFDAHNYVTKVTPVSEPSPGAVLIRRAIEQGRIDIRAVS